MKISKAQQQLNRLSLIDAAVKLSTDKQIKEVSMRSIAKEAGLSDAAIYNYFSSKEELVTGYFEERFKHVITAASDSVEFNELMFKEKLQWLIETYLENISQEEEFVRQSYHHLFEQPIAISKTAVGRSKKIYVEFVSKQLSAGVENKEFEEPPFSMFICELLWDMHIGVVYYWLNDKSEQKLNTTQIIELSLNLLSELLKGQIFNKFYKIGHFLFKEHMLSKLFDLGVPSVR